MVTVHFFYYTNSLLQQRLVCKTEPGNESSISYCANGSALAKPLPLAETNNRIIKQN